MSSERESSVHPTLDRLEAWADGRLDAATAALVERHFARCADCRQLAGDLRGFGDPVDESAEAKTETEASLGRLRLRILAEELAAGEGELGTGGRDGAAILPFVERPTSPPTAVPQRQQSPLLAWAAVVLITCTGFFFAWERQREVERLRYQPLLNIAVIAALPEDDPQRGSVKNEKPSGDGTMVVVANQDNLPFPEGNWRALIEDRDGRKVAELDGLRPQAGKLRFVLLSGAVPPGRHRLRLFHNGAAWETAYVISLGDG